jgi:hypothetical protein
MAMITQQKKLLIAAMIVLLAGGGFIVYKNSGLSKNTRYSCLSSLTSGQARCIPDDPSYPGCYGYYPLRGSTLKDGIRVDGDIGSTCEGIATTEQYIFDSNGDFVEVVTVALPKGI